MPFKRKFGELPQSLNFGSPHQTPASLMIDTHYHGLQLVERWTWTRYARFCAFLKMTPYEVASLVLMRHSAVEGFRQYNRLTGHNNRATALLLTLLEAHMCKDWSVDIIENPFPPLNSSGVSTESTSSVS